MTSSWSFILQQIKLLVASRNSNNLDLINYYKRYCKILSALIKEPEKLNYAHKIKKSLNKNKTIWDTINLDANKTGNTEKVDTLNLKSKITDPYLF